MQGPLKDKNDIKIFILYLLRNIGYPLDFDNINDIVVQDGVVGYFDFADCFADLLERRNVVELRDENRTYYQISEQGVQIVESLQSDLMNYVKTRGLKSALRLLNFRERGAAVETSFQPRTDGSYDLTCAIRDQGKLSLEIKLVAENSSQLELMRYHFRENPEQVYKGVLALMTGELGYLINED